MSAVRVPKTDKAAAILAERYAVLEGQIGHIDGVRNKLISDANANADKAAEAPLKEQADIRAALGAWWGEAGATLTKGKRKSIELGGCEIGTRRSAAKLAIAGDEDELTAKLQKRKWATDLLITSVKVDRRALLKALDGTNKRQLLDLGCSIVSAVEAFFVKRTEQDGTLASAT